MRVWRMVILHRNNYKVQEKLCTETRDPEQDLEYAIAFGEVVERQKTHGVQNAESSKSTVKAEPAFAVEKTNPGECFRCGESNVTMERMKNWKANNY